jgi:uncharacterized membrane protein
MDSTLHLLLATVAFLALHVFPSTPLRAHAVQVLGEGPYLGLFSLFSAAGLVWMSVAYGRTPMDALWPAQHFVPVYVLPFAFVLLACGLLARNPTLTGQAGMLKHGDAARGILRITRHPVMWAIMLWAGAHMFALGSIRSVVLFGGLLLLAAAGTTLQDARKAKSLGDDWKRFTALTSNVPFAAIARGRNKVVWKEIGWWRPAVGFALFALLLWFHPWLFGYRPY